MANPVSEHQSMEPVPTRAEVTVYSPLFSPFRQSLDEGTVSIGRASDCTIPIKDRYLSRRHAEIIAQEGLWYVKDLGSANGTYLNGARVERDSPLRTGDRIRLGDTEIVFMSAEHNTDKMLAVAEGPVSATNAISLHDLDKVTQGDSQDISRLQTLTVPARELLDAKPITALVGSFAE